MTRARRRARADHARQVVNLSTSGEEETRADLDPHAFALAHALTVEEGGAGFPLQVRAAWSSFLRRLETSPEVTAKGAKEAHEMGLMHAGRLTPEGVRVGLLALSGNLTPPLSEKDPAHAGQGGQHGSN